MTNTFIEKVPNGCWLWFKEEAICPKHAVPLEYTRTSRLVCWECVREESDRVVSLANKEFPINSAVKFGISKGVVTGYDRQYSGYSGKMDDPVTAEVFDVGTYNEIDVPVKDLILLSTVEAEKVIEEFYQAKRKLKLAAMSRPVTGGCEVALRYTDHACGWDCPC